ncbi:MAG TPA: MFS transporter [Candidatus Dormibacteraeota bacterium]|nr:MFS transporter [Candidatus Dormibacteraeota bacterium]
MMSSKTQIQSAGGNSSRSIIFYLLAFSFVLNGLIITFIGTILPEFRIKWGLDDSRAGFFFFTQFSLSLAGVLLSSVVVTAKGFKPAITVGIAMMGAGFALLNARAFPLALAASGIYGLGYGLSVPGTNLWAGESYGERRASALSILNLAWGIGAIASAPLAKWMIQISHVTLFLRTTGALSLVLAFVLSQVRFGEPSHAENSENAVPTAGVAGTIVAALLGVLFFVYVGTEVSTSGWSVTHAQRATTWAGTNFLLTQSFFYAGLLGGRGASAAILLRLKEATVAVGGLLLAAAGGLLFLSAHSATALFTGAFFAGLGLSSLFPIYVAWLSKWFGARARKVGGVMFALAAAGSALMPPLVGIISRLSGSLRIGLLVPVAGCAVMLTTVALLRPNRRG